MNRTQLAAAAALCASSLLGAGVSTVHAIDLNEKVALDGYLGASYRYTDADGSFDSFDIDAAKLQFTTKLAPVTGVFSLYYTPTGAEDVTLLDAYVAYDAGQGITLSAGKFLSWHGYEAFDLVNMSQLTYATGDFLGAIPGYHYGVRAEKAGEGWVGGIAVLDSVYTPAGLYLEGDGELKENAGFEAYYKYTGVDKLALYFGAAYDTKGGFQADDVLMLNFWSDYAVSDTLSVAGELIYKDSGDVGEGWAWTGYATYRFTDTISTLFRVGGEYINNGPEFLRGTVAPTFTLTPNLAVRAEFTYTNYDKYVTDDAVFAGVQTVFRF